MQQFEEKTLTGVSSLKGEIVSSNNSLIPFTMSPGSGYSTCKTFVKSFMESNWEHRHGLGRLRRCRETLILLAV